MEFARAFLELLFPGWNQNEDAESCMQPQVRDGGGLDLDFRGWGQLSTRTTVEPAGQTGQAAGSTAQKWVKGQTEHIAVYGCLETPEVNGRGGGGFAGSHCVHVMRWGRGSRQSYQLQAGFSSGSGGVAVCLCRRECAITKKIWLSRSSMSCAQSRVIFENSCAKRPLQRVNFFLHQ